MARLAKHSFSVRTKCPPVAFSKILSDNFICHCQSYVAEEAATIGPDPELSIFQDEP